MANIIQKAFLTLLQYALIILLAKLFRIQVSPAVLSLILISGVFVYALTSFANQLLIKAIKSRNKILFKALIVLKVNVSNWDKQWRTPLHYALNEGNADEFFIRNLLAQPKVRINAPDRQGITPVMLALSNPNIPFKVKEAFCNHPDFNLLYTNVESRVPAVPSLLLEAKHNGNTDPQLEILLKTKLNAAREYLHWENNKINQHHNSELPKELKKDS